MTYVYKILREQEWQEFQTQGSFVGSAHDKRDGFIHLSEESQLKTTLKKHFKDEVPLYIVKFPTDCFPQGDLKWEKSSSGETFPHLYNSALNLKDAEDHQKVKIHWSEDKE